MSNLERFGNDEHARWLKERAANEMYWALKRADKLIDAAYATAEWLAYRRSIETDAAREQIKQALARAEGLAFS